MRHLITAIALASLATGSLAGDYYRQPHYQGYQNTHRHSHSETMMITVGVDQVVPVFRNAPIRERQECRDVEVPVYSNGGNVGNNQPSAGGMIIGGIIGNMIGAASGINGAQTLGTVVGGIAGAELGRENAGNSGAVVGYQKQTQCHTVHFQDYNQRPDRWLVEYRLHGRVHTFESRVPVHHTDSLTVRLRGGLVETVYVNR